jgi:predicted signal transduction protein with EAL and GGDEF domain
MKISAVAEGVETKSQVAGLKRLGCAVGQGFYFSQPLHPVEFDRLLTCHFSHNAASAGPVPTGQGAPAQAAAGPLALPGR